MAGEDGIGFSGEVKTAYGFRVPVSGKAWRGVVWDRLGNMVNLMRRETACTGLTQNRLAERLR